MYFDTHAHYDDKQFDADRELLLSSMPENAVDLIVNPGCDVDSSRAAIDMAERYEHVYAAVGFHPEEVEKLTADSLSQIAQLSRHPKCVAIGEIGLDYYWDQSHKEEQKALFLSQIELALELDKPVIVHDREAHGDCMEMVFAYPALRGVFHCFSGSMEMAKELLKRGWYLGFDGPITYKNARKALEVLEMCPLDRILVETDSPYLAPVPRRGKRNDSANLQYIIAKLAEIKGIEPLQAAEQTKANGKMLFGIK